MDSHKKVTYLHEEAKSRDLMCGANMLNPGEMLHRRRSVVRVETAAEWLLFTTIRIVTPSSVGTGVIVEHRWGDDLRAPFLITNKHVVERTTSGKLTFTAGVLQGSRIHGPELGRHISVSLTEDAWIWIGHPSDDVDVTALPLANVFDHLQRKEKYPYYKTIPTSTFPGQDAFGHIDAIEDILFVGYPNGIYDQTNNLPITRRGLTATPLYVDYDDKPIFLIDASVFPGSSGSPVFLYNSGYWSDRGKALVAGNRVYLLGILASAFFRHSDGTLTFEEVPSTLQPTVTAQEMIDLGIVYKARTIMETIKHLLRRLGEIPE